jgi:general secretion pathway protein G
MFKKYEGKIVRSRMSRGFTLIELLLVMVILGVLAAVVVPKLTGRAEDAKIAKVKSDISTLKTAIASFEIDNGRLPNNDEGLVALVVQPADCPNWHPTIEQVPADPWGREYIYAYPGQHPPLEYDLYSLGKEGQEASAIGNFNMGR